MKRKWLVVGIILLFITMIVNPATAQNIEKQFLPATKVDDVYWTMNGTMGNYGWYINPVTMTCIYNHYLIVRVYYEYDGSGWVLYTEPFTIYTQGPFITLSYYVIYKDGNVEFPKSITFKIDYTPPLIELSAKKIEPTKWWIRANVSDATSGVVKVEFYLDNQFLANVTAAPYEWFWTGVGRHTVKAIAYDCAGNNASSSTTMPYSYGYRIQPQNQFLLKFLEHFPYAFPILRQFLGL
jgi:hypothetical protein